MKSGSPSRTPAAHKTQTKSRPGPLSSCNVVSPLFILPELLHRTQDRFIITYSTSLAPFPWQFGPALLITVVFWGDCPKVSVKAVP